MKQQKNIMTAIIEACFITVSIAIAAVAVTACYVGARALLNLI
jgi:hypothetical protein